MENETPGIILLTYKGKVLLMHKQNGVLDEQKHPWTFIGGVRGKREPLKKTIERSIKKEMGIDIKNIEQISEYCYYAPLTDDNVNNIKRGEHQLLDFFNPGELGKLFLSRPTKDFLNKYWSLIPNQ